MKAKKYINYTQRVSKLSSLKEQLNTFLITVGGTEQKLLIELWKNWDMVMGTDLSCIVFPLGRKDQTLVVGVENAMALQEVMFMKPEILERVNAFMDREFFDKIDVQLCMGRQALGCFQQEVLSNNKELLIPIEQPIRKELLDLHKDSPISKCYKAYIRMCGWLDK